MSFFSSRVDFRHFLFASLVSTHVANAQNLIVEKAAMENQSIGESSPEEPASVEKQSECEIVLKNASSLGENQEFNLIKIGSPRGTAILRKLNPDSTAEASLDKNFCNEDFSGATVEAPQSDDERKTAKNTSPSIEKLPPGVNWGSSAHERIRKKIVMRAGVGLMFGPGSTLAVGYNLSHRLNIEGSYDSAVMFIHKVRRRRFGGLGNLFFGNSFYTNAGLIYEIFSNNDVQLASSAISADPNQPETSMEPLRPRIENAFNSENRQLQLQFGVGNRWNNEKFVIGAEWVGLSTPLLNLSEKYNRASNTDDGSFKHYKESNRELAHLMSLRMLNWYLGFSF
ncbi:MAG: hypothetical protein RIR26_1231 [Pseudomonadota bacterium]